MPSENKALPVTTPNYFRPAKNVGAADIQPGFAVQVSGDFPGCELATDPEADQFMGVSVEIMTKDGPTRSVQVEGRAAMRTGGAFSRGARITWDSLGRAVEASAGENLIGYAETASAAADDWAGIELRPQNFIAASAP